MPCAAKIGVLLFAAAMLSATNTSRKIRRALIWARNVGNDCLLRSTNFDYASAPPTDPTLSYYAYLLSAEPAQLPQQWHRRLSICCAPAINCRAQQRAAAAIERLRRRTNMESNPAKSAMPRGRIARSDPGQDWARSDEEVESLMPDMETKMKARGKTRCDRGADVRACGGRIRADLTCYLRGGGCWWEDTGAGRR